MPNNIDSGTFDWIEYYEKLADKLLTYKNNRSELIVILREVFDKLNMNYPFLEKDKMPTDDICPFTVFGSFNRGIKNENRIALINELGNRLNIETLLQSEFSGVPVLNNMKSWFFSYKTERQPSDISNLWNMFEAAIEYADHPSNSTESAFKSAYDTVKEQKGVKWNLTMGLFWIRPRAYLNLDETNRDYLSSQPPFSNGLSEISRLNQMLDANTYLKWIGFCKDVFQKSDTNIRSFPALSNRAWVYSKGVKPDNKAKRYWMYAPGEGSRFWDEFYEKGIMGIGWDELGDLKKYDSKESMKQKMKEIYGEEQSYKNDGYATWQFANEMNIGDIVFVKRGRGKIIGRGIVTSDYIYDKERDEYNNIRRVEWTHKGLWDHEGQIDLKTLTNITSFTEYCRKLENLLAVVVVPPKIKYDPYTENDFLNEVFMDRQRYLDLKNLLLKKKNIILEGAPGVGKTFMAERLAFSIMGEKDTSRVKVVQFHQSYSYEDFIMGYRPTEQGFTLKTGAFYDFCKEAEPDDKEYFFIIDEINRGNLSKIFGELLMLIENDKRGKEIRLLYQDEQFAVPKNVYIIGMMNTADRSLAMIDYALRRRFSFFEMPPAFESKGFIEYQGKVADKKFDNLVKTVIEMNSEISADASLGDGFRIGHSYFCTDHEINDEWLNSLVEYELLPLIKEYWFDEPAKIEHWSLKLRGAIHD